MNLFRKNKTDKAPDNEQAAVKTAADGKLANMPVFSKMKKTAPEAPEAPEASEDSPETVLSEKKLDYLEKYEDVDDAAPGWDAIDEKLSEVYGDDEEYRHYAAIVKYDLGGDNPLDGISVYDSEKQCFHRHIVSYGMSELYYSPESVGREYSRWGFEFTMRVVPFDEDPDTERRDHTLVPHEPHWAMNLMQNLAKYVYDSKKYFDAYHFIPTNSPLRLGSDTKLVGILFAPDPELGGMDTEHGRVEFLQMIGITQRELDWLFMNPTTGRGKELVDKIRQDNPMLVTDLTRREDYV